MPNLTIIELREPRSTNSLLGSWLLSSLLNHRSYYTPGKVYNSHGRM